MRRYEHSKKFNDTDKKYINRYPLIEDWGWDRSDCVRELLAASGQVLLLFLPQHETAGDFGAERALPRPLPAGRRYGGQGDAPPYQR